MTCTRVQGCRAVNLEVAGMTCASCETTARLAVERIEGVTEADFSYSDGTGTVRYDTTLTSQAVIIAELERATGYGDESRRLR